MKKSFIIVLALSAAVFASDSLEWRPNPPLSAGLSLLVPGAGQIYNRSYWKAPIAVGLEGYCAYIIADSWREMSDLEELGRTFSTDSPEFLSAKSKWESARERRNIHLWLFTGFVLISAIDAYVDAHLYPWRSEMAQPIEGVSFTPILDSEGNLGFGVKLALKTP